VSYTEICQLHQSWQIVSFGPCIGVETDIAVCSTWQLQSLRRGVQDGDNGDPAQRRLLVCTDDAEDVVQNPTDTLSKAASRPARMPNENERANILTVCRPAPLRSSCHKYRMFGRRASGSSYGPGTQLLIMMIITKSPMGAIEAQETSVRTCVRVQK
jgi:hypothetical protein